MPNPGVTVKKASHVSRSHDAFPVRKRPVSKQSGKVVGEINAKIAKTRTELRLRKSDGLDVAATSLTASITKQSDPKKHEHLRILKQFDLDYKFGPCGGITRMERWNRAAELNKKPPVEVKNLVENHMNDNDYVQGIWYDTSV